MGQIDDEMLENFIDVEDKTYGDSDLQKQYANYRLMQPSDGEARVYIEQDDTDVFLGLRYDYSPDEK